MNSSDPVVNSWQQPALFSHGPTEIYLRIGLHPIADHAQIMLTSEEGGGGELLSMQSVHHCTMEVLPELIEDFVHRLRALADYHAGPF